MKFFIIVFFFTFHVCNSQNLKVEQKTNEKSLTANDSVNIPLEFIIFSIVDQRGAEKALTFKEKYGVGFKFESDVIDPLSYKKAQKNNINISEILTEKFGSSWIEELPYLIPGIKSI